MTLGKRGFAWVIVLAAGCPSEGPVVLDVPESVQWVVVIERRDDEPPRRTGLRRWPAKEALPVLSSPGATVELIGYSDLDQLIDGVEETELSTPLTLAEGCRQSLGPATYYAEIQDDGTVRPNDPAAAPSLGAPWLDDRCADVDPELLTFHVSCREHCPMSARRKSACALSITGPACVPSSMTLTLHVDGACMSVDDPEAGVCAPASAPARALASSACADGCSVDVYQPAPAPFDVVTVPVLNVRPLATENALRYFHFDAASTEDRYLYDLVAVGDSIIVSHEAGRTDEGCEDPTNRTTALSWLRQDTLEIVNTATAPPCLIGLSRDPVGMGFLGAFADGSRWMLGRFDAAGKNLAQATLHDPSDATPLVAGKHRLVDVVPVGERVAVVLRRRDVTSIVVHRRDTLERVQRHDIAARRGLSVSAFGDDRLLISQSDRDVVCIDLADGSEVWRTMIPNRPARDSTSVIDVLPHAGSARIVAAVALDVPYLQIFDEQGGIVGATRFFGQRVGPMQLAPWGPDSRLVLAAGATVGGDGLVHAVAGLVDPRDERFLPVTTRIGGGNVGEIATDASGRYWVLLPWNAEVARITPR